MRSKVSSSLTRRTPVRFWRLHSHGGEMPFQGVEVSIPGPPVGSQPLVHVAERFEPDAVDAALRVGVRVHEACVAQNLQVFGDRRLAERQRLDQVAHRPLVLDEEVEDPPPTLLGQDLEGARHPISMPLQ